MGPLETPLYAGIPLEPMVRALVSVGRLCFDQGDLHLTLGPSPGPSRRPADPCAWKAGSREDRAKGGPGKIQGIGQSAGNLGPRPEGPWAQGRGLL